MGGVVDDLAARGSDARRRHHILGEGLRPFDPGGRGGRPEAGDPGRAHGVSDTEHQRDLRSDHHQVRRYLGGEVGDRLTGRDVHVVLFGDRGGAGVAGSGDQAVNLRVPPKRHQQRMFTGTGADHQDAHS